MRRASQTDYVILVVMNMESLFICPQKCHCIGLFYPPRKCQKCLSSTDSTYVAFLFRVIQLTKLPRVFVERSEDLQVKYNLDDL